MPVWLLYYWPYDAFRPAFNHFLARLGDLSLALKLRLANFVLLIFNDIKFIPFKFDILPIQKMSQNKAHADSQFQGC